MKPKGSIFRSAITDDKGDVDVGYLSLLWGLVGWGVAVFVILGAGMFAIYRHPDKADGIIQAMGLAIGTTSGGFATMLGAVGLFRIGDKPRLQEPGTTTATVTVEKTEKGAAT